MSLPLLESMFPLNASEKLSKPPVRSAFIFMPNGVWPKDWNPVGESSQNHCSSPLLANLKKVEKEFILFENLWNKKTVGRNGHWPKVPAFLGGGYVVKSSGRNIDVGGTSVDQLMAQKMGSHTPLPSLELSIDRPRSDVDHAGGGFAKIYGNHISWRNRYTPVASERVPLMAFNRMFKSGARPNIQGMKPNSPELKKSMVYDDKSILDIVREDAKSLQKEISERDREKLDEYFESVRSIEIQIQNSLQPHSRWENKEKFTFTQPEKGIPKDHEKHIRLMQDLILLAFWTDSTRVASLMLGNAQSDRNYSFLTGIRGSHHQLSHHREEEKALSQYRQIVHFNVKQLAYFLEKMSSMNEGSGSLLDNSMVLFGSSIKDGNWHSEPNLPIILAGKGGGSIQSGKRITMPEKTPLCNLYLSMLNVMNVSETSFGDSTGKIF